MSHNIQNWSKSDSTITAVPRPWTGVVACKGDANVKRLVKCSAPTRSEAIAQLREQLAGGETLVAAFFGDHSNVILDCF